VRTRCARRDVGAAESRHGARRTRFHRFTSGARLAATRTGRSAGAISASRTPAPMHVSLNSTLGIRYWCWDLGVGPLHAWHYAVGHRLRGQPSRSPVRCYRAPVMPYAAFVRTWRKSGSARGFRRGRTAGDGECRRYVDRSC
jgi:hypothetical protein